MTHKRRLTIQDDEGHHIMAVYVEPTANGFEGADLSGLQAAFVTNLRGTSFKGASLYWANFYRSDFSGCNFEGANLEKAHFEGRREADGKILTGADLRGAFFDSATNLDGATFFAAGFPGALVADAHWGDIDKGTGEAEVVVDHTYTTPMETHNPMEPHATIAHWEGPHLTLYDASKGAVNALTRQLAIELAPHGFTTAAIAPGLVETPLTDFGLKSDLASRQAVIEQIDKGQ